MPWKCDASRFIYVPTDKHSDTEADPRQTPADKIPSHRRIARKEMRAAARVPQVDATDTPDGNFYSRVVAPGPAKKLTRESNVRRASPRPLYAGPPPLLPSTDASRTPRAPSIPGAAAPNFTAALPIPPRQPGIRPVTIWPRSCHGSASVLSGKGCDRRLASLSRGPPERAW
jgi:hypothetical protein